MDHLSSATAPAQISGQGEKSSSTPKDHFQKVSQQIHSTRPQFNSVQDVISVLGKAHMLSTPSFRSFPTFSTRGTLNTEHQERQEEVLTPTAHALMRSRFCALLLLGFCSASCLSSCSVRSSDSSAEDLCRNKNLVTAKFDNSEQLFPK